jgi:hypothetical protein
MAACSTIRLNLQLLDIRYTGSTNQPDTQDTDHRGDSGLNDIKKTGMQLPPMRYTTQQ